MMGVSQRSSYSLISNVMLRDLGPSWQESRRTAPARRTPPSTRTYRTPAPVHSNTLFYRLLFGHPNDRVRARMR